MVPNGCAHARLRGRQTCGGNVVEGSLRHVGLEYFRQPEEGLRKNPDLAAGEVGIHVSCLCGGICKLGQTEHFCHLWSTAGDFYQALVSTGALYQGSRVGYTGEVRANQCNDVKPV